MPRVDPYRSRSPSPRPRMEYSPSSSENMQYNNVNYKLYNNVNGNQYNNVVYNQYSQDGAQMVYGNATSQGNPYSTEYYSSSVPFPQSTNDNMLAQSQSTSNIPQAFQPTFQRSNSAPVNVTQESEILDIVIFDYHTKPHHYSDLMDTGATGVWVAQRVVEELNYPNPIYSGSNRQAELANGTIINSHGTIRLEWRVAEHGRRTFKEPDFEVFDSESLDVVLGMDFLRKHKVISKFDISRLCPLKELTSESAYEREQRLVAEQQQRAAAQASAERREKSKQKKNKK